MTCITPWLDVALPGYEARSSDSGVAHSRAKLGDAGLSPSVITTCRRLPCTTEEETWSYRCSCTFQIVQEGGQLQYAMRCRKLPVLLRSNFFPIANHRIQAAMKGLWHVLNNSTNDTLTLHLTSVSFASSWNETDCFVTLYYGAPFEEEQWKSQAAEVCRQLNLLKLTGRSKGRVVWVGSEKSTLSDTVWLCRKGDSFSAALFEQVGVHDKVAVHYEKPETAFFHPNGRVMIQAIEWLISRLQSVVDGDRPFHMLEMYCGCGVHTVALASTGLLQSIVAIELDGRLVDACADSCRRNHCLEGSTTRTPVHVVKGDAAEWARKSRHTGRRQQYVSTNNNSALHAMDYQVLLVDPPRMGLDNVVCEMANKGTFEHIFYISCGRKALQRDLIILGEHFDVMDCTLLDLFPRTDSVESLVHLERRQPSVVADGCEHFAPLYE